MYDLSSFLVSSCHGCVGGNSNAWLQTLVTTAQTLVLNVIASASWQLSYSGYFGFSFVQWEEEELRYLSIIYVNGLWSQSLVSSLLLYSMMFIL